ncbi:MAG TPA: hypothetical protein VFJ82_13740, partial [Longimicrobium sp.]|nr:hypothetical protein [Longimicrobium sp.]
MARVRKDRFAPWREECGVPRPAVLPDSGPDRGHTHPGGTMARKLMLDPESLSIESFDSGNADDMHG